MKKIAAILTVLALCATTLFACSKPAADVVKISQTNLEMAVGDSVTLTATVEGKAEAEISWSSTDPAIAAVNSYGAVVAKKLGTVTVTATSGGGSATCTVKVLPKATLDITEKTLIVPGEEVPDELTTVTLTADFNPALSTSETVTWTSSAEGVATVAEGVVTAVAEGTAVITVKAANGAEAKATIKVEALNAEPTVLTFNVDIADALAARQMTELPAYVNVYLAGMNFGWGGDAIANGHQMTKVDGSKTKYTYEVTFDFSTDLTLVRSMEYKYILGTKLGASSVNYEAVNGSPVDNRKLFVNYNATMDEKVTVFQGIPGDPDAPVTTNITIELTLQEAVTFDIYMVGDMIPNWELGVEEYKFVQSATNPLVYTLTFTMVTPNPVVNAKINDGTWNWNYGGSAADNSVLTAGGDNLAIALPGGDVTLHWTLANATA